jgi:hypothetical protein
MTDLVERLRSDGEDERQRFRESRCTLAPLLNEAAADIERLRAALRGLLADFGHTLPTGTSYMIRAVLRDDSDD